MQGHEYKHLASFFETYSPEHAQFANILTNFNSATEEMANWFMKRFARHVALPLADALDEVRINVIDGVIPKAPVELIPVVGPLLNFAIANGIELDEIILDQDIGDTLVASRPG